MSNRPVGIPPVCTGSSGPHSMRLKFLARTGDPVAKLLTPNFRGDAYALYERMRTQGPVHRSRTGMLAVLSYDNGKRILEDPRFWPSDSLARPTGTDAPTPQATTGADGHCPSRVNRYDQAYAAAAELLQPALHQSTALIDTTADQLLGQHTDADSVDLVDDFAFPLVVACLSAVLGIPSTASARFATMCDVLGRPTHGAPSADQAEALHNADEDLAALVIRMERERRQSPGSDLISRLTASYGGNRTGNDLAGLMDHVQRRARQETPRTSSGRPDVTPGKSSLEEVAAICRTLIISGLDTAVCLFGNAVAALAAHPDQWQILRTSPQLAGKAAEEALRFDPPHQFTLRVPSEQVDVAGHTVPPRSGILVMLAAAHRDPHRFPDPARFDLARSSRLGHLVADGAQKLENALAQLAGEVALRALASRLPLLRPAGQAVRRPGGAVSGFAHLPIRPTA
ncbi:cytochrome P450 [Streptomyces atroolivaceus]|uniref:cytochrome P450 n=1 Tax=Streptomyces atroolivaceus TaxID=66869 RepID=UPI00342F8D86